MNNFLISIILASVWSFFIVISQSNDENKDKTNDYIKIFIISGISIYIGLLYLGSSSNIEYVIKGGSPPF